MQVEKAVLIEWCKQYGAALVVPPGIDGPRLLWGLAGNESSFGAMCTPRHENGWCTNNSQRARANPVIARLSKDWGCLAHCSFGPLQIMAMNSTAWTPMELLTDQQKAFMAAVVHLSRRVLPTASTLDEIGDAYNSGNCHDGNVPHEYIERLKYNYHLPMGGLND